MNTAESLSTQWERQVANYNDRNIHGASTQGFCPLGGSQHMQNVGTGERITSLVGGAGLLLAGRYKGSLGGLFLAAMGAGLIYRGISGRCMCYEALGLSTATDQNQSVIPAKQGVQVEKTITVNRPAHELYETWRHLTNLPQIFRHLKSVHTQEGHTSHWIAKGPMGVDVEWDAEILNDHENRLIAWRSLPNSQIDTAGSVRFKQLDDNHTEVNVTMRYNPPGGKLADHVASWLGSDLETILDDDLQNFKQAMDAGGHAASQPVAGLS